MVSGGHTISPGIPTGRLILGTEILSSTALESVERGLPSPTRAPPATYEACVALTPECGQFCNTHYRLYVETAKGKGGVGRWSDEELQAVKITDCYIYGPSTSNVRIEGI